MPFSIDEVKSVVWCCAGDKSPGHDGFNFKLIKAKWNLMEDDIFRYIKHFEKKNVTIAIGCNSSFITLILKVVDPLNLGIIALSV